MSTKPGQVQYSLTPSYQELEAWAATARDLGYELLMRSGYPVVVPAQMFARYQDYGQARFVLAGRTTGLEYNTYGALAGNFHAVRVRVAWELFDSRTKRLLFSESYIASASGPRNIPLVTQVSSDVMSQRSSAEKCVDRFWGEVGQAVRLVRFTVSYGD